MVWFKRTVNVVYSTPFPPVVYLARVSVRKSDLLWNRSTSCHVLSYLDYLGMILVTSVFSHRAHKDVLDYKGIITCVDLARITVPLWSLSNLSSLFSGASTFIYDPIDHTAMTEIYHKHSNRIAL